MKKQTIVLDFDGTIADAEDVMLRIYKPLAEQYNWPKLTRKDYYQLKKGSPREIMRWANVKIWQIPRLLRIGRAEYKKHLHEIRLFNDMPEVLEKLSAGSDVYILSSNDRDTVKEILKNNGLTAKLVILHGSPIFSKDRALKKLLRSHRYDAKSSWMIGDEIRDVEAGKKARMKTIGVTWGLQSEEGIKKSNPDYIAKKPDDIINFIYND